MYIWLKIFMRGKVTKKIAGQIFLSILKINLKIERNDDLSLHVYVSGKFEKENYIFNERCIL